MQSDSKICKIKTLSVSNSTVILNFRILAIVLEDVVDQMVLTAVLPLDVGTIVNIVGTINVLTKRAFIFAVATKIKCVVSKVYPIKMNNR